MPFDPYTNRLWQIESNFNPNSRTSSNRGLGQFGPQEERMYGINDANRTDPNAQAAALDRERTHHSGILSSALGRDPTPGELYLTHQQGVAGGPALLTADPSMPAWQVIRPYYGSDRMAKLAITGNIGSDSPLKRMDPDQISAGGFSSYWKDKFENRLPAGYSMAEGPASGSPAGLPVQAGDLPATQTTPSSGGLLGSQMASAASPPGTVSGQQANPFAGLTQIGTNMMAGPQIPAPAPFQLPPMQPLNLQRPQIDYSGLQRLLSGGQRGFS